MHKSPTALAQTTFTNRLVKVDILVDEDEYWTLTLITAECDRLEPLLKVV